MFREIKKHMKGDERSVAEEFHLTHEDKFTNPTLEQKYWANPNAQRGETVVCSYVNGGVHTEVRATEGV